MSIFSAVKGTVLDQAVKLAGNPRVTKLMGDPRLMNAAMKAMSLGGTIKNELDRAGRMAAGVFGLATQEEMSNLRGTIQGLEDTVAGLEAKAAAATAEAQQAPAALAAASDKAAADNGSGGAKTVRKSTSAKS